MDVDISNWREGNWLPSQKSQSRLIGAGPNTENTTTDKMHKTMINDAKKVEESGYNIYKQLHVASFGILLNISAYYGLINLQSSINIQQSLGTIGLTVGYVSSVLWSLFVTPIAIEYLGAKTALIISEMSYLIYCAANFYPSFGTLIPAAVILGFGEACSWTSMSVLVTYYGEKYWEVKQLKQTQATFSSTSYMTSSHNSKQSNSVSTYGGRNSGTITSSVDSAMAWMNRKEITKAEKLDSIQKGKNAIFSRFFGRYFSIVKASQVVGNILSYIVIGEKRSLMSDGQQNMTNYNDTTEHHNQSVIDMNSCGITECVGEMNNMSTPQQIRYQIPNQLAVYLLFGGFIVMHIVAMCIHFYILEPIPRKKGVENIKQKETISYINQNSNPCVNNNNDRPTSDEAGNKKANESQCQLKIIASLGTVFQQMISPQQVLISPISLYFGVFLSFCLSEFTRAFISCTIGVSSVGLVMIAFGFSSMTSSFLLGKVMPKTGPNALYFIAALIDIANYTWIFKWSPSQDHSVPLYLMAGTLGFNAGLWEPLINSTYARYFPNNTASAFSLWNFWAACGIFIGFALSSSVCLILKLYVLIGALILGMVCYICAEYQFQKKHQSERS